jgi:hypothetical protein
MCDAPRWLYERLRRAHYEQMQSGK